MNERGRVETKRWCDPVSKEDGFRLLACRYRPRGVRKEDETWHAWWPDLGPSRELHAAIYGKSGPPIGWGEFRRRYLAEMKSRAHLVRDLAERVRSGETITLLCSSGCVDPARCHRTLLAGLVERAVARNPARAGATSPARRSVRRTAAARGSARSDR